MKQQVHGNRRRIRDLHRRRRLLVELLEDRRLLASDYGDAPDGELPGRVAAWNGASSGTTILDAVGDNHGELIGATIAPGRIGQAFSFDGVDDYLEVPDSDALDQPGVTDRVTLSAWVNWSGGPGFQPVVRKIVDPLAAPWDAYGLELFEEGRFFFRISDGANQIFLGSDTDTRLTPGRWQHIAGTYDGTTQRLFLDGEQVAQKTIAVDIVVTTGPLRMGSEAPGSDNHYAGLIDDVAVYDRALSEQEVRYVAQDAPSYNTLATNNGASHTHGTGVFLGFGADPDDGTLQNISATADDSDGFIVDEEGLLDPVTDLTLVEADHRESTFA